jgi:hypothetical protein
MPAEMMRAHAIHALQRPHVPVILAGALAISLSPTAYSEQRLLMLMYSVSGKHHLGTSCATRPRAALQ